MTGPSRRLRTHENISGIGVRGQPRYLPLVGAPKGLLIPPPHYQKGKNYSRHAECDMPGQFSPGGPLAQNRNVLRLLGGKKDLKNVGFHSVCCLSVFLLLFLLLRFSLCFTSRLSCCFFPLFSLFLSVPNLFSVSLCFCVFGF